MSFLADAASNILNGAGQAAGQSGQALDSQHLAKTVVDTFIYVIAAVAVIMLIIGGMRYVLSGGNAQATKGAKDTIVYALIGVVVAIAAYAIVHYVLSAI